MSKTGTSRETRSLKKTNQRLAAINEIMDNEETPAWAQHLLTEFTNFRILFDTKMTEVTNSIKELKKDTRAMNNRISNAENRIGTLETEANSDSEKVKVLIKNMDALQIKMDNTEMEFRKKNLMFMGLPEGLETTPGVLNGILRYVLDLSDGEPTPEIESQRRTRRPLPDPDDPPRPFVVRILRWSDRQRILESAARKKKLSWQGKPFWIQQDLSMELRKKRAQYDNIRKVLQTDKSVRYGILHPARFIVTIRGETSVYKNAVEAAEDLKMKLPDIFKDWP